MALPQFPNVFYGSAEFHGIPAPKGMVVTAVVDMGADTPPRTFSLTCHQRGKWGWPNGLKLKVGGSGDNILDLARVTFYVTDGPLPAETLLEAGHSHFHDDSMPHITRLKLCQD